MQFKTSRRQFLLVSAGLGSLAVLNACAPKAEPTAVPAPKEEATKAPEKKEEPTAAPKEAINVEFMWRTNPNENPMNEDIITAFQEEQDGITVEQIVSPWDEFEPKLMSMYAGGIAPDVLGTGGTNPYVERHIRGMVLVLDPYADTEPDLINDLYEVGTNSYTIGGELIGLPFSVLNAGVFINATRFEEAGVELPPVSWTDDSWTWDAMIEKAKALTLDSDGDGKIDRYGLDAGHSSAWTYTRLWGQDVISEEDYQAGIVHQWQTDKQEVYDAMVNGLQARADVVYKHEVGPDPATASALNQMGSMLKTGAIAMSFTGGWAIWGDLPEEFEFRCAPNPIGGENGSGTRVKNTWCGPLQIVATTDIPDESWEWAKFYCGSPKAHAIMIDYRPTIPAAKSAFEPFLKAFENKVAMSAEDQRTYFEGFVDQMETTVPCHILSGWAAGRDAMRASLDPVWSGDKTVAEIADKMIEDVNAKYAENIKALGIS